MKSTQLDFMLKSLANALIFCAVLCCYAAVVLEVSNFDGFY